MFLRVPCIKQNNSVKLHYNRYVVYRFIRSRYFILVFVVINVNSWGKQSEFSNIHGQGCCDLQLDREYIIFVHFHYVFVHFTCCVFSDHITVCTSHFITKSVIVSLKLVTYRINYWTLLVLCVVLNMNSLDSGGNDKASVFIFIFVISYICNCSSLCSIIVLHWLLGT
jgi:hypothetical protein